MCEVIEGFLDAKVVSFISDEIFCGLLCRLLYLVSLLTQVCL